jgi:hypothetical protein
MSYESPSLPPALFIYYLEPASSLSFRFADQNFFPFQTCCIFVLMMIHSLIDLWLVDMMVMLIEKACQVVRDRGNLSLVDVECSSYGKGHRLYFKHF